MSSELRRSNQVEGVKHMEDMENNKDIYDEKREKKRKVHREWQRKNKDKVRIYHERYSKKLKLNPAAYRNNYDHVSVGMSKGKKAVVKERAKALNKSVNKYINDLINADLEQKEAGWSDAVSC
jgi:hypothetical protein